MSDDSNLALKATLDYSGVSQGFDAIISKAGQVQGGLSGALSKGTGDFKSIGKNIGKDLVGNISSQFGPLGNTIGGIATAIGPIGVAAGIAGVAITAMVAGGIQAAAQFETAMSGAKKVISLDEGVDSGAYFQKLGQDLQEISLRAPVAANDMAALAAVGGSLGVGADQIAGFAESAAQMSVAFELPAEEAATAAAKILNAFQQPISTENMQSLGNVINQIGDSMAATESDILDFTNRASFLNTTMGLSVAQVATLGGVLISAGMSAETASSGIKSALNTLTSETSKTGGMDNWAKLMEVPVDDLKAKIGEDLPNTLIDTANKIADISDPVERFQTAVQMAGSEGAVALLKLAGSQDTYNSALADTISQWDKGQSGEAGGMAKTFEQNSSTFEATVQTLKNSFTYASVAIGNVFLPAATAVAGGLKTIVVAGVQAGQALGGLVTNSAAFSAMSNAASSIGTAIKASFSNLSAIISPVWNAIGGGITVMSGLQTVLNIATAGMTLFATGIGAAADASAAISGALAPVAELVGGTLASGLTTASVYAQAFGETIVDLVTKSSTFQTIVSAVDSVKSAFNSISEIGGKVFDGLTTAIPTAVSGLVSAVGSLFTDAGNAAITAFGDVVKNSPLGPILGFASDVSARADEIMATGEAAAASLAEGLDKSEKLAQSRKDAVDLDNPENLEAAKKAGINIGEEAGSEMGKSAAKAFEEAFITAQNDRDIAKILSGSTATANITDVNKTQFEYLGEQFEVILREHGDAAFGAWTEASIKAGDAWLGKNIIMQGYKDPVQAFEMLTGMPAPEEGTAAYYYLMGNEIAAKKVELQDELKSQVSDINLWEVGDSQRSWMKFSDENKELAATAGDEIILALYEAEQKSIADNDPTLSESLANVMGALASPGSVPAEIFNQSLADIIDAGYIGASWKDDLTAAANTAVNGLVDSLTGTKYTAGETRTTAEIIADGEKNISDLAQWRENVFQPGLKSSFEEMHEIQDRGYASDKAQTIEWINDKKVLMEEYSDWFTEDQVELLAKWGVTITDAKTFYDLWADTIDEGSEKVAGVLNNNDEMFYGSIQDLSKGWTDYVNEYGGYIGPTDQRYVDYVKNTKTDRIDDAKAAYEELKDLGWEGVGTGSINVAFQTTLDTAEASMSATELVAYVENSNPTMELQLDTSIADARFQNLYNLIVNANPVMSVQVDVSADAYQIQNLVRAAIADAIASA